MSLIEKHKQWVLDTVDRLRQRKARPDLDRISRMVERFHGLTHAETKESLDKLCEEGSILKVHFKGSISYRHIRNYDNASGSQNALIYNTSSRIVNAIKTIMKQTGDGVSFQDLEHWLISKNPDTRLVKHRLNNALQREIARGNVTRLPDCCYVLTESLPKEKIKPEHPRREVKAKEKLEKTQGSTDKKSSTQTTEHLRCDAKVKDKFTKKPAYVTTVSMGNQPESRKSEVKVKEKVGKLSTSQEKSIPATESKESSPAKEQPRRGRPLSKRKRFKKTHGPDFENPLELKKGQNKDKSEEREEIPVCDFCTQSAECNREGKEEPLLVCKECDAKAHPSCMEYSPELAERALNSPWQCMECKMCAVCGLDGLENSEVMLFCDACDKGYHMTCHRPSLTSKPKGKWVCTPCKADMNKDAANEQKVDAVKMEEVSKKRGKKRKMSSPASPLSLKCPKPDISQMNGTLSDGTGDRDFTGNGGSNDTACLPTPSASPRPSDTFDYEMKMSLAGLTFPSTEDPTIYSDATDWDIEDVFKFFQECGFEKEAAAFADQEIDGKSLLLLRREDVLTGLGLKLGPAVKIYKKIARLQQHSQALIL